jgi:hypothetical protein
MTSRITPPVNAVRVLEVAALTVASAPNERRMEGSVRKTTSILGLIVGLYFVVRAVAEPFTIDMTDPATYRDDWGGPSLAGVLLVHCGPGVISAALIVRALLRRRAARLRTPPTA